MNQKEKLYDELVSHVRYDFGYIQKINDFLGQYSADLSPAIHNNCIILKATIYHKLNAYSDAIHEIETMGALDFSDPQLANAGLLLSESLLKCGNNSRANEIATSIAKCSEESIVYQKLSAVRLILEANESGITDKNVIKWINELFDFFGLKGIRDNPVINFTAFYRQQSLSNKNFSNLLMRILEVEVNDQHNLIIDEYIKSEPLDYYRNKAKLLRE